MLKMMNLVSEKLDNKDTLRWLSEYLSRFKDEKIPISFMHGDCTATNIISSGKKNILIDWEECVEDGIPIDITYFNFRKQIDNNKKMGNKRGERFLSCTPLYIFPMSIR